MPTRRTRLSSRSASGSTSTCTLCHTRVTCSASGTGQLPRRARTVTNCTHSSCRRIDDRNIGIDYDILTTTTCACGMGTAASHPASWSSLAAPGRRRHPASESSSLDPATRPRTSTSRPRAEAASITIHFIIITATTYHDYQNQLAKVLLN